MVENLERRKYRSRAEEMEVEAATEHAIRRASGAVRFTFDSQTRAQRRVDPYNRDWTVDIEGEGGGQLFLLFRRIQDKRMAESIRVSPTYTDLQSDGPDVFHQGTIVWQDHIADRLVNHGKVPVNKLNQAVSLLFPNYHRLELVTFDQSTQAPVEPRRARQSGQ